jgi:hypothetical protein
MLINGNLTNDPQLIANEFASAHSNIVNPPVIPNSTLDELLLEYNLTLFDIFPQFKQLTSPFSTTKDFKKVLKSMKSNSAPGISTQTKVLFEFLFDIIPNITTKALNYLYTIDIDKSPFAWIKDRNIIFLPKNLFGLSAPDNCRPISLLELVYKILSKALNNKISPLLSNIVSSNQFGFVKQRQMAVATISITSVLNHINTNKEDAQLLSFDFSKAFDKTLPQVTDKIINHILPNGDLAKAIIQLTNGGTFRAKVNECVSSFFDIVIGSGQGDPYSSTKFLPLNHIFVSCLSSPKLHSITYKINSQLIQPGSFADDNWFFTKLKTNSDVQELKTLLVKLKKSIGLEINFAKTKILVNGKYPDSLNTLGNICQQFKHLGVQISFNHKLASKTTYDILIEKIAKKAKLMPLRAGYNLLKRRNLCLSLLNSMCYHIYRVYAPNENEIKRLWKEISKFLWSICNKDGEINYRYKISQKRIELPFYKGGLNFLKPENQAFSIWLTSFFNVLVYAYRFPQSNIGIVLTNLKVNMKTILSCFSYKSVIDNQKAIREIYPLQARNNIEKMCSFFYDLEHNSDFFFQSPISQSCWSNSANPLTQTEISILKRLNKLTFASILQSRNLGKNVFFIPELSDNVRQLLIEQNLLSIIPKLESIINATKNSFPRDKNFKHKKLGVLMKPISAQIFASNSIFSLYFKRLLKQNNSIKAPSVITRSRDKLYFPDNELFFSSFKKLFGLPIILHYKCFFYEQFLRVLPSRNKLFKFKLSESNMCLKCPDIVCTTEHAIFECPFPKYFSHALALFLDAKFNQSRPQYIFLRENFFLFNMFYDEFSIQDFIQLSHLILISKERALKSSNDISIMRWNHVNYFSQSLLITQFARKLLLSAGFEIDLITSFFEFLVANQLMLQYFI